MLADVATVASAQAGAAGPELTTTQKFINSPVFFILPMLGIFYFMILRPQQQRAKAQAKLLAALKAGDRVITASGIIGTVITVKDKQVSLRSADAKFEVTKASVTEILPASSES